MPHRTVKDFACFSATVIVSGVYHTQCLQVSKFIACSKTSFAIPVSVGNSLKR